MKTLKLFSMAALALVMAACSNDDNEIQQPAQQGPMKFTATLAAPNSGATNRTAATKDGSNYNVAWAVNDPIALVYEDKNSVRHKDVATVTAVDGSGNATITATLSGDVLANTPVTLVYPSDIVFSPDAAPFLGLNYIPSDSYFNQNVTNIEDALPTLDWREGSAYFAVGKTEVGLNTSVTMASQVAIWKLNLTVGGNAFTAATSLESLVGEATVSGGSVNLFVPLPFFNAYQAQTPIEFSATADDITHYVYVRTGTVTLTGGKIYESTLALEQLIESTINTGEGASNPTIYHTTGETWRAAIQHFRNRSSGNWEIRDNNGDCVYSNGTMKYLKNSDGSAYISPDAVIDPSETYTWGN